MLTKHFFQSEPSEIDIKKRIEIWNDNISKEETKLRDRDENKDVALGTSKINYMDPRITVAWCKRCEVPIEKVFPRGLLVDHYFSCIFRDYPSLYIFLSALLDKFNWAMAVPPDWQF